MAITGARARTATLASAVLSGLTGCGASEVVATSQAAPAGEGRTEHPLTLENCGSEVTVESAPARVVSLDQNSTEILLSLGLEDRIVGTASWTDPVLDSLADANESVPRLADNARSARTRRRAADPRRARPAGVGGLTKIGRVERHLRECTLTAPGPSRNVRTTERKN